MISDVTGQLIHSTFEIGRLLRTKMMVCAPDDMHMGQLHALVFIREQEGITMKELAKLLHVTSPSATSFITRLEKMGYVKRTHDKENRKLVRVTLTPSGRKILESKMTEKRCIVEKILSGLTIQDQKSLLSLLQKMIDHCSTH